MSFMSTDHLNMKSHGIVDVVVCQYIHTITAGSEMIGRSLIVPNIRNDNHAAFSYWFTN